MITVPSGAPRYPRQPVPEVLAAQFRTLGAVTFTGLDGNPRGGYGLHLGRSPGFLAQEGVCACTRRGSCSIQFEPARQALFELGFLETRWVRQRVSTEFDPVPRRYLSTSPKCDQAAIGFLCTRSANSFVGIAGFAGSMLFALANNLRTFPSRIAGARADGINVSDLAASAPPKPARRSAASSPDSSCYGRHVYETSRSAVHLPGSAGGNPGRRGAHTHPGGLPL